MNQPNGANQKGEIEKVLQVRRGIFEFVGSRYVVFVLLIAIVGAASWYYFIGARETTSHSFITEPAGRGRIVVKVTATGTVQPTTKVDISSEISGIMRRVLVDFNSKVKIGDLLAELNNSKERASFDAARARLSIAHAKVDEARIVVDEKRIAWKRKEQLGEKKIASRQDLDTARANYHRALAAQVSAIVNIDLAKAELQLQETTLKLTRIISPINGIVLSRKIDPGQIVKSSLQAPVLFTIARDLTKMEVQVNVDEADVGKVKKGQRAVFTVDAYPDRKFDAVIRRIHFGSQVIQGVVTYMAVLATDNANMLLRPGMTATAEITVQISENALTISNQALRYSPPRQRSRQRGLLASLLPGRPRFRRPSRRQSTGPFRRIWLLRDGKAVAVRARIGPSDGKRSQVLKGNIREGDAVIIDTKSKRRRV